MSGLLRHTAMYSAEPLVRQLVAVVMQRFYTTWLAPGVMGVKEVVDLWAIGLQQLLGQNVLGAMVRFYFDRQDEVERARVVTSCTLTTAILAWIVCGASLVFSDSLASPLLGEAGPDVTAPELVRIVHLLLVLVPFQLSTIAGFYYLQILERSGLYSAIKIAKLALEVGMYFWLIGARGMGVEGFLIGMLVGEGLATIGLTGWMLATLRPRIDARILWPILAYAAPLVPMGICQLALHQVDRRLLVHFGGDLGRGWAGIYGHGYKIGYLVTAMMLGPFIQIFQPWIFAVTDPHERGRLLARISSYAVLAVGGTSLGVVLFGRQAAILLAGRQQYWAAYEVIPWVAGGYVFWALYHVSQMPLFIAKRTGRLLAINLAAVLVNVGLNAVLIPREGYVGAGIVTCVTFIVLAGLGMIASRSEARVPFELGRIGAVLFAVVLGGALALWIDRLEAASELGVLPSLGAKSVGLAALLLALWYGVVRAGERTELRAWIRARRGGGNQ
ncbi:MAG: polysaccharide biosynthesis C-terminal domain-containing protein [Planctomycetota bacterium]